MMPPQESIPVPASLGRRLTEGLRTRYRPPCRINHVFFTVTPWLDVLILAVCVIMALSSRAIVPGVRVQLPTAAFQEGLQSDLLLIINPLPQAAVDASNGKRAPADSYQPRIMVFFNDDRFNLSSEAQLHRLSEAIAEHLNRVGSRDALLVVDRWVNHGDVMSLVAILRTLGVRQANIAVKPR